MVEEKISKTIEFCKAFASAESILKSTMPERVLQAHKLISHLDFPTTRLEEWKYTRTTRISSEQWEINKNTANIDIEPYLIPELDADIVVFVNGIFRLDLSRIQNQSDIHISEQIELPKDPEKTFENIFDAIHTAYCTGKICIATKNSTNLSKSVHIIHISAGKKSIALPIVQVSAKKNSHLHLVETFVSLEGEKSLTNRHLEVHVEENASLHIDKFQAESDENFLMNEENISIESNGRFTINTLTADGGWVRNNLKISLEGKNIEVNLNGIYLPRKKQHIDNHTKVNHKFPNCNSNELYKGILNDQSSGVFNGKVFVQQDAQKTNAFQSNANILLSDDAQMNSKPELEIYADDVKCSHGSTTGQLDENALFYLKSRGLNEDSAKKLLTTAFIVDVLNKIDNNAVRNYVTNELVKRELILEQL